MEKTTRKSSRSSRILQKPEEKKATEKLKLKDELRQKLREKQLARCKYSALEQRMDNVEDTLKNTTDKKERARLKKELELLERVEDAQINRKDGDPAEYTDNGGYGGSMVRND